ncbi:hypothetical protein, partial [Methylocystis silviterrae]|uniref:hypothetical protein n=1 Tax=Methylocystis silviterrae TaxID=2743612 RepID=UPI001AEEC7EB
PGRMASSRLTPNSQSTKSPVIGGVQVIGKHAALSALSHKRSVITLADVAAATGQVDEHILLMSAISSKQTLNKRSD